MTATDTTEAQEFGHRANDIEGHCIVKVILFNPAPAAVAVGAHFVVLRMPEQGRQGDVSAFFRGDDQVAALAAAEAWLRDALAKVEVAKIDAANAPALTALTNGVTAALGEPVPAARIGEPIDPTGATL